MNKNIDIEVECLKAIVLEWEISTLGLLATLDSKGIVPSDFRKNETRAFFTAIEVDVRNNRPYAQASFRLKHKHLDAALVDEVFSKAGGNILELFPLLKEANKRARAIELTLAAAQALQDSKRPAASEIEALVADLGSILSAEKGLETLQDSFLGFVDELESRQNGELKLCLPTGFEALDAVVGGWQPTLNFVGALPSVGKSSLIAGSVKAIVERGLSVGLISLEDERHWITRRIVSLLANVPVFVLANRRLGQNQLSRVGDALANLYNTAKVFIDDRGYLPVEEVVSKARQMIASGARAIFIDHLGEIRVERSNRHDLDILDICVQLRALAKEKKVPVVVLAHVKQRENLTEFDAPEMSDFAFSAAIPRTARLALGLFKVEGKPNKLACSVLKQTQGARPTEAILLNFDPNSALVLPTSAPFEARGMYGIEE